MEPLIKYTINTTAENREVLDTTIPYGQRSAVFRELINALARAKSVHPAIVDNVVSGQIAIVPYKND